MALLHDHFRRHILGASTKWVSPVIDRGNFGFRQAKISNVSMAINVNHNILRLKVSVNDVVFVDLLQPKQNLGNVEPGFLFIHFSELFHQVKKLSSGIVLHDKNDVIFGLKGEVKLGYVKLISESNHDVSFIHDDAFLLVFDNERLWDDLHCVEFSVFLKSTQIHITEPSTSNTLDDFEWIQSNGRLFLTIDRLQRDRTSIQKGAVLLD